MATMSQQGQQLDRLEPVPMEEPPAPNAWETETLPPDAEPAVEPVPTPKWMRKRRACVARHKCLFIFGLLFSILLGAVWILPSALDPMKKTPEQIEIERRWVDSSPYALDRACCRWFGLCGLHHLRSDTPGHSKSETDEEKRLARPPQPDEGEDGFRSELRRRKATEASNKRNSNDKMMKKKKKPVPEYVLKHAPLVHLHWDEHFWPADLAKFIKHVHPTVNGSRVDNETRYGLENLDALNKHRSKSTQVTMASEVDVETRPEWLFSHYGRPDISPDDSISLSGSKPDPSGRSASPAVLIVADKGNGTVDAFWFFFYAYNLGQTVLGARYGNHVGDWEHCMVRFQDGKPTGVFLSEHEGGLAYEYDALTKKKPSSSKSDDDDDERPVVYSAVGSHAMYATPGNHAYVLPFEMLKDVTNDGPLWDPTLNALAYHYESPKKDVQILGDVTPPDESESLVPSAENPDAPTGWFHYGGAWGDALFPLADKRQWRFFGQYHYVRGPFGPKWKHLGRKQLCTKKTCKILSHIDDKGTWHQ